MNVRHYRGGMHDWIESGGPVSSLARTTPTGTGAPSADPPRTPSTSVRETPSAYATASTQGGAVRRSVRRPLADTLIDMVARTSFAMLLGTWFVGVLAFGLVYWALGLLATPSLLQGGVPVDSTPAGLLTAIYFSFVTATSVGFGDVVPFGMARVLSIVEAAAALLIFGAIVSKLVSRRQEQLTEEIHHIAFEDRLGRVRANLHMVLSDLLSVSDACSDGNLPSERMLARVDSGTMIFAGEIRTVHDLLYRPQQVPDESVLESILASLAAGLQALSDLLDANRSVCATSEALQGNLRSIGALAEEICGECVPREYAPALRSQMDRIRELARRLSA